MISAIIMASGLSRRMGENKLLLRYGNSILAENVFRAVKEMNFDDVVVVSQYKEIFKLSDIYNFKIIYNKNAEVGQSESIKLGLNNVVNSKGIMMIFRNN
jgi:molybdenum cofactor cytidylyltransferase